MAHTRSSAGRPIPKDSGDNKTANADEIIARALGFFGHDLARDPIKDPVERGRKLAHLVGERRSLLILDGLEPLQDLPLVNGGCLKDRGLAVIVKELAAHNKGLLVITSRQEMPELAASKRPRVVSHALDRLDNVPGVALLAHLGVHGKRSEMEAAVEDVLGHALSLSLLGTYLDAVYGGDVNQREHFKLGEIEDAEADFIGDQTARFAKRAARIMEGMLASFEEGRATDGAETAILHIVGLFDRPAEKEALDALLSDPPIPGLTDAFCALPPHKRHARWNVVLGRLRKLRLLNAIVPREPGSLDAHPIVRAHFGSRLQHRAPEAFREAHSRLYDFYRYLGLPEVFRGPASYGILAFWCNQTLNGKGSVKPIVEQIANGCPEEGWPEEWHALLPPSLFHVTGIELRKAAELISTAAFNEALRKFLPGDLNSMGPSFSAISHGCAAGRHQEAYSEVWSPRVRRVGNSFIAEMLGAANADLAALASFYEELWSAPVEGLPERTKARVLNAAAFSLRALGRVREAVEPYEASLKANVALNDAIAASLDAGNISELRLTLGNIAESIASARTGVAYADKSDDAFRRMDNHSALADALHQGGQAREASKLFKEAEAMQAKRQPQLPKLYSMPGYRYCDLLLARGRAYSVMERAKQTSGWMQAYNATVLTLAVENLSLGRAYAALLSQIGPSARQGTTDCRGENAGRARRHLDISVEGFRGAGQEDDLPRGLLARAAFSRATGEFQNAAGDLDEVNEIAERGEMRLYLTDYHLESARLLLTRIAAAPEAAEEQAMPGNAEEHYAAAKKLIEDTGYNRRLPELEAIRACLDGRISASMLDPDRDRNGRSAAQLH